MRRNTVSRIMLLLLCLSLLPGCEPIRYYGQAVGGQIDIWQREQAIAELLANPKIDQELRRKLLLIQSLRTFAFEQLALPHSDNYTTYANLDRPFVVWNVFATPEFSFTPKVWCYPIAGCASYRGYFSEKNANAFADNLKQAGWDVFVGGIAAYSTLGYFDDPVLSTFINRSDIRLAALIFHELSHQVVYVADDTTFNESFAVAVEQAGLQLWLKTTGNESDFQTYLTMQKRHKAFIEFIASWREKLATIYQRSIEENEKRRLKRAAFATMQQDYNQFKQDWQNYNGYDRFMAATQSNAKLLTVTTYSDLVADFSRILAQSGSFEIFYENVRKLAKLDYQARREALTKPRREALTSR